jgi:hypothetical protein
MSVSRSEWVGFFGFFASLVLAGLLSVWALACEHGSLSYIDGEPPTCVELVTDECVPEVVAEFCDVTHCEIVVVTECPDVDVVETDTDTCDLSVPVGHRPIECRGRDHD